MDSENLRQLVYVSRARRIFTLGDLQDLARRAEERNQASDVGGALLYGRGLFLQALEGPSASIDGVFARISLDPRHTEVERLIDHSVKFRWFRNWAMTPIALDHQLAWTDEHIQAVRRISGVASVVPPGTAPHTLLGSFTKHVQRLNAA